MKMALGQLDGVLEPEAAGCLMPGVGGCLALGLGVCQLAAV